MEDLVYFTALVTVTEKKRDWGHRCGFVYKNGKGKQCDGRTVKHSKYCKKHTCTEPDCYKKRPGNCNKCKKHKKEKKESPTIELVLVQQTGSPFDVNGQMIRLRWNHMF